MPSLSLPRGCLRTQPLPYPVSVRARAGGAPEEAVAKGVAQEPERQSNREGRPMGRLRSGRWPLVSFYELATDRGS
jgi:hypothetical protein